MNTGTVKFYNSTKSFGLFTPDQSGRHAFAHVTALVRAGIVGLGDGQTLS
ncbi:MAG: cold-shock protein [Alphaproteobacteria bacterium]|nr:MAG: cold-shock protein [Alphaproteobacteria bacterium]